MKLGIYAVRDTKLEAFGQPYFSQNNQVALRTFTDAVNQPDTQWNNHPEDFALYRIGEYDDEHADISPEELTNLGLAADYIRHE